VVTVGFTSPYYGYRLKSGGNIGSILPTYPYTEIGSSAGEKWLCWSQASKILSITGNVMLAEVNGLLLDTVSLYYSANNRSTYNDILTNPFPTVGSTCIVKVKLQ